ncbi:MAG: hypothetical protein K8I04_03790 [Gammaproteobacteria bacterium]|nr:hypothetical protein [Gammaproteobacteria bacterium]
MRDLKLAFDDRCAVQDKAQAVVDKLTDMWLREAADNIREVISEMLTCNCYSAPHWHRIRTNSPLDQNRGSCNDLS